METSSSWLDPADVIGTSRFSAGGAQSARAFQELELELVNLFIILYT